MFWDISGESERLKREASWLDISLFKSLRILMVKLSCLSALSLFREEMMWKTSLVLVGGNKNESWFVGGKKSENLFLISNRGCDIWF